MGTADLIAELRRRGRRGPLWSQDLEHGLRARVLRTWGSMAAARRAAGLAVPSLRRRWSDARVLEELRRLHRSGQHMSQNAVIDAGHRALVLAACQAFGSWTDARARAGLPELVRRSPRPDAGWDDAQVLAEVRGRHRRGESLAVTKVPRALSAAAFRRFGSWRAAIEAAGFDYAKIALSRRVEDDEVLAWLRRLARKDPHMQLWELDEYGGHVAVCKRRWGSLEAAARAAGLEDWPKRTRFAALSRAEVIRGLRARARAGQPLSWKAVRQDPSAASLRHSLLRHFSGWDDGIAAAGLPPQRRRAKPSSPSRRPNRSSRKRRAERR